MYVQFQYPVKITSSTEYVGREFDVIDSERDREDNYSYVLEDRETGEILEETFYADELEEV